MREFYQDKHCKITARAFKGVLVDLWLLQPPDAFSGLNPKSRFLQAFPNTKKNKLREPGSAGGFRWLKGASAIAERALAKTRGQARRCPWRTKWVKIGWWKPPCPRR